MKPWNLAIPDAGDKDEYGPLARLLSFKTPDGLP